MEIIRMRNIIGISPSPLRGSVEITGSSPMSFWAEAQRRRRISFFELYCAPCS